MSRIDDILVRVRDSLSDTAKQRWTDARLLRLVDDGHKDIAKFSKLLKGQVDIPMLEAQFMYDLPDDLWLITRAAFDGYQIDINSYDQMDEISRKQVINNGYSNRLERSRGFSTSLNDDYARIRWETTTSNLIQAIVTDNRELDEIRVYPIPNDGITGDIYTFLNGGTVLYVGDEVFGVVTEIDDYTLTSPFGVVTELMDPSVAVEAFSSAFGIVALIKETTATLHIWYIRNPVDIIATSDALATPKMFDVALRYYIIGNAYMDDNDARDPDKSRDALAMYTRLLEQAEYTDKHDGVRNPTIHTTTYRSAFE